MSYNGYLSLGSAELINSRRAAGHALHGICSRSFELIWDDSWGQQHVWLGDEDYITPEQTGAPWVQAGRPESLEFGGVYGLNIDGLDTTKIDQDVTEATGDGGSVGRRRLPTREVKVECLLMAATSRGLEWGLRWLTRSLLADGCGGDSGPRDLVFLESCPDYRQWERPADVRERAGQLTRTLTSVVVTKTPEVTNRYGVSNDRGDYAPCMAVVEFELTALVPRVWRSPVVLLGPRSLSAGEVMTARFQELDADGTCPANCDDDEGVLLDPKMGDLWTLPRPTAPGVEIGCMPIDSRRSVFTIREGAIPLTGEMLPTVVVRSTGREERNIRIRWARGLVVDDGAALDCQTVGEAMATYLPADSVLTLDGRSGAAWADLPDGRRVDATPVMVGRAGGPWRPPVMTCGAPYTLVVDAGQDTTATVEVTGVTGEV